MQLPATYSKNAGYLLALSGGLDSMVMAHLFLQQGYRFAALHGNFRLREEESDGDQALVEQWCEAHGIPVFVRAFDTAAYAEEKKCSIQEAARELRYAFFEEIRQQQGSDYIATAHHLDDRVETLLFHFFRGTGLSGLRSIPSKQGFIVRPLLGYSRHELEAYAAHHGVKFRHDSSNDKTDYTRNRIRHRILPFLEAEFPGLRQAMYGNLTRFDEAAMLYTEQIERYRTSVPERRGPDTYLPIRKLRKLRPLRTILYELGRPFGFSASQTDELLKLMEADTGAYVESASHRAIKNRDFIILTHLEPACSEQVLLHADSREIQTTDFKLTMTPRETKDWTPTDDAWICEVDTDQLRFPLIWRKWKPGDYLYPLGMQKKKKVARLLIDAKIPLHEKEQIWVLESDHKLVWVAGVRMDHRFRVKEKTRQITRFRIQSI